MAERVIGLVGAGTMGAALVEGVLSASLARPGAVLVSDPDRERRDRLVRACRVGVRAAAERSREPSGA